MNIHDKSWWVSRKNVHTFRPSHLTSSMARDSESGCEIANWISGELSRTHSGMNFRTQIFANLNGRTDLAHVLPPLIRRPLSALRREPIFFGQLEPTAKNDCRRTLFPAAWPWTTLAPMLVGAEKIRFLFLSSQIEFPSSLTACPAAAAAPPPSECIVVIKISEKMKRHWAENSIDDVLGVARPTMSMISRSDGISNALRNECLVAHAVTLGSLVLTVIDSQLNRAN